MSCSWVVEEIQPEEKCKLANVFDPLLFQFAIPCMLFHVDVGGAEPFVRIIIICFGEYSKAVRKLSVCLTMCYGGGYEMILNSVLLLFALWNKRNDYFARNNNYSSRSFSVTTTTMARDYALTLFFSRSFSTRKRICSCFSAIGFLRKFVAYTNNLYRIDL